MGRKRGRRVQKASGGKQSRKIIGPKGAEKRLKGPKSKRGEAKPEANWTPRGGKEAEGSKSKKGAVEEHERVPGKGRNSLK